MPNGVPLQNRVTPFGEIIAVKGRGLFTGNRGIIHDPLTRRLLRRRWASKSWLICLCDFKNRRRTVMGPGSWTELFFLDEATALAAGHRPCFECRRHDAERFRDCWRRATGGPRPSAPEIDTVLDHQRRVGSEKRSQPLFEASPLPVGAMVGLGPNAWLIIPQGARLWSPVGYGPRATIPANVMLLTPPATVEAIAAGYSPVLHDTASD